LKVIYVIRIYEQYERIIMMNDDLVITVYLAKYYGAKILFDKNKVSSNTFALS